MHHIEINYTPIKNHIAFVVNITLNNNENFVPPNNDQVLFLLQLKKGVGKIT